MMCQEVLAEVDMLRSITRSLSSHSLVPSRLWWMMARSRRHLRLIALTMASTFPREIKEFSTNALALEFGSIPYDVNDYIRNYDAFLAFSKVGSSSAPVTAVECKSEPETNIDGRKLANVFDSSMVELDRHHSDRRGNLTVVENGKTLPFDVKRVYYLYDVPGGESRGAHAHRELSQLIIAASGSFTVTLDDGKCKRTYFLNRPYQGLYVKPGMWRDLGDFSSGAVCMVLASDVYKADDYIRTYEEFLQFRKDNE